MDAADAWLAARRAPAAAPPPAPAAATEPTGDAADSWLSSRGVERPRRSQSFDPLKGPGATDPEPSGPLYSDPSRPWDKRGYSIPVGGRDPMEADPIAQGVVAGALTAPMSAAMPLVARAVGPALARPVVAGAQGAAGAALTGGNPLAGAAMGAAPAALGAARQIAVGGAGARVQSRLVGDVTGEGGKTRAPKRIGDKIAAKAGDEGERLDATLRELPELRKQIAVHAQGNPGKTMRAVDDTLDVLTPQNDAVFDMIQAKHGGVPFGDMVQRMTKAEVRLNAAGKAIEADAVGAVRDDVLARYGGKSLKPAEAKGLAQPVAETRLASLTPDEFKAETAGGLTIQMYRGQPGASDPGTKWWASRPATAAGYATPTGIVRSQVITMSRPYVASTTEMINAGSGMIARLKNEGYDGIVTQWSGGIPIKANPHPEKEIWAVAFTNGDKISAEAIRNYRNDLGAIAFKGNPNVPPTAKAAGLSRVYDEMNTAIEAVAAKTEGVDMAAFKARNRQIATLIPVRDALKERAAAQSQGKRALGETVKAAVLPIAMGSSLGIEGAAIGAGLYGAGKLGANLARRGDYRLAQLAERFPIAGAQNPATDAAIGMGVPGAVGAADNVPTLDPAIIARLRAFTGQGAPNAP